MGRWVSGSGGEVQIKMKLLVIPKTLSVAENMLRVVKNCNVSMAEFDKQFWINQKTDSLSRHCSLQSIPLWNKETECWSFKAGIIPPNSSS